MNAASVEKSRLCSNGSTSAFLFFWPTKSPSHFFKSLAWSNFGKSSDFKAIFQPKGNKILIFLWQFLVNEFSTDSYRQFKWLKRGIWGNLGTYNTNQRVRLKWGGTCLLSHQKQPDNGCDQFRHLLGASTPDSSMFVWHQ